MDFLCKLWKRILIDEILRLGIDMRSKLSNLFYHIVLRKKLHPMKIVASFTGMTAHGVALW